MGGAEEQPEQDAGPDDDADYEYMEDGAQREAGETQALGPATEEQAAELHGTNHPDQGAHCTAPPADAWSCIHHVFCSCCARSICAGIARWPFPALSQVFFSSWCEILCLLEMR